MQAVLAVQNNNRK